ncbi:sulfurtransferase [Winogradskyella maritima]|uniref:Sulfurtransferase n=1 Tax=Winogradskyella maritima TaxID=1517766 RepID=A0ABV8AM52_9FLAO|nr:sulfurtransferase [Winogradskyella maritima]
MKKLETPLVSVDWLKSNLKVKHLVVLDATIPKVSGCLLEPARYIPGARFFDIKKKFSAQDSDFPNTLPSVNQFEKEAQALGINKDSLIVCYDRHGMYSAPRAFWLFKHFGHTNVAVLDGGLPEWESNGSETTENINSDSEIGNFEAKVNTEKFTDFEGILEHTLNPESRLLDARPEARFNGDVPEPRKGLRSGTIPKSFNLPYSNLLEGNRMKSKSELEVIFNGIVEDGIIIVTSCGSGITACILALGATIAGYDDVIVYDGSWTEYSTLTEQ